MTLDAGTQRMSLLGIETFMYRLKNDPAIQRAFAKRSMDAYSGLDLAPDEVAALQTGDVATLYRLGVHPLLLAPYSRYAGIPRPQYQASLAPLRGLRQLKS